MSRDITEMKAQHYEPTEYEAMLIAAGWVEIERLDPVYMEYTRRVDDAMGYQEWIDTYDELIALGETYDREIEPHYKSSPYGWLPYDVEQRQKQLLKEMSWLECVLGL